jgi:hypothetical protein
VMSRCGSFLVRASTLGFLHVSDDRGKINEARGNSRMFACPCSGLTFPYSLHLLHEP